MDTAEIRKLMEDQLRLSRRLRARVREMEDERHAPLAVVGMGMRLPGDIDSPEAYWEFLREDGLGLSGLPPERPGLSAVYDPKPQKPGKSYVDRAGFLSDVSRFDAEFFGLTHREAKLLDPQQRMLLETSWEALERAGIAVRRADRLNVGVYLGMMASEYTERLEDRQDMSRIDPYYTTGGGLCFGAGRISFVMGFSGPVMSVDTACSSSLSALHLAVQGLRRRECRYALVCGSNLLLSASLMVSLCQTRALSPDGRSKSFLANANGYGRGEGVGSVALMRLDDAEHEGRPVLAVLRGSAVNHDGAASGLTAPNGPAQQEVIRAALADARVEPQEVSWVEAHGTGTPLGDPIEIGALDAVLGAAVRERGTPLYVGSVKSRIGHLEAASGIAALMKTALVLQHGEIPAAAAEDDGELNPHIPWERLAFAVPRRNMPWPASPARRVASINSFGMSGTNVHVVMAAHDHPAAGEATIADPHRRELLTLSARSPEALRALAEDVANHLRKTDAAQIASVCHTLRSGRAPFAHRLAVTGSTATELADAVTTAIDESRGRARTDDRLASVSLYLAAAGDGHTAATAALGNAFPHLTEGLGEVGPGELLAGMLERLALRVDLRLGEPLPDVPDASHAAAFLVWRTDGAERCAPLIGRDPQQAPEYLLTALAGLFADGADLRMDGLRGPTARFTGALPTYPFQRQRYWVDEPPTGRNEARVADGGPSGSAPAPPRADDRAALVVYLQEELKGVLDLTGDIDPQMSFLDIGGDSFLSSLFITKVEENYTVGLTPEDLPLDLSLHELFGRLADDIADASDLTEGERTA